MNKRYLLVTKDNYSLNTTYFYILKETKITANVENANKWLTTIIDLENENIKWQGCE